MSPLTLRGIGQAVSQTTRRGIFMDIREIQRLHAQFAPDSMVIDLPRQIAALPGPGDLSEPEPSRAMHARLARVAPRARKAAIAVAVAAMVAMAGMGAASLYKNIQAGHLPVSTARAAAETKSDASVEATGKPAVVEFRDVDATPPHPVSAAPTLSASDFASASSLGLTADQFRNSLKTPARAGQPATSQSAPALSSEAQLAAVSPIHRAGPSREAAAAAPQPAPPVQPAPAQAAVVAEPAPTVQPAAQTAQVAQPQAAPAQAPAPVAQVSQPTPQAQTAEASKPAHAAHRHISRPRAEQNPESSQDARPAAESRAGSAEVKMF
jgi:hypothetical protein